MQKNHNEIKVPAQRIIHPHGKEIYTFPIDGKKIFSIAKIAAAKRSEGVLIGHQRGQVATHIKKIQEYVERPNSYFPNSVIIAFDERVKFTPHKDSKVQGTLTIPITPEDIPGCIIDGQQRLTAINKAEVESYPIHANAFIAKHESELLDQFMNVNSAKPIKNALIFEMSAYSADRSDKYTAQIVERLNFQENSPLFHRLKLETHPNGDIAANSIKKIIENSMRSGGMLSIIADEVETTEDYVNIAANSLGQFFIAVQSIWEDIWPLDPKKSKLLSGVGLFALGKLMDRMFGQYLEIRDEDLPLIPNQYFFAEELLDLKPFCKWNEGSWEFHKGIERHWNELQNLSSDKKLLSEFLLRVYQDQIENYEAESSEEDYE